MHPASSPPHYLQTCATLIRHVLLHALLTLRQRTSLLHHSRLQRFRFGRRRRFHPGRDTAAAGEPWLSVLSLAWLSAAVLSWCDTCCAICRITGSSFDAILLRVWKVWFCNGCSHLLFSNEINTTCQQYQRYKHQKQMMKEQDQGLEMLGQSAERLSKISMGIHEELGHQNKWVLLVGHTSCWISCALQLLGNELRRGLHVRV